MARNTDSVEANKRGDRPRNMDLEDRRQPCELCGQPIGIEAMVKGLDTQYHARCWNKFTRENRTTYQP